MQIDFKKEDFINVNFTSYNDCALVRASKRMFPEVKKLRAAPSKVLYDEIYYPIISVFLNDQNITDNWGFGNTPFSKIKEAFRISEDTIAYVTLGDPQEQ